MSEPDLKVTCSQHGDGISTFVCVHLRDGISCGFNAADSEGDPWPDAWCDRCEIEREQAGGWNKVPDAVAKLTLLCTRCYEVVRERNRTVPPPLEAGQIQLPAEKVERLIVHASNEVRAWQERATDEFRLSRHDRWSANYESGQFAFATGGRDQVIADMQLVGSFSKKTGSWLWSWANEINEPHLFRDVRQVRAFGRGGDSERV